MMQMNNNQDSDGQTL